MILLICQVNFDVVPVKSTASKQIIMRNIGQCATDFQLSCTHPAYTVSPKEGTLQAHASCTIQVSFNPHHVNETYEGDLVIEYTGGDTVRLNEKEAGYIYSFVG